MSQAEAQSWWADVQEVKERIERRRALQELGVAESDDAAPAMTAAPMGAATVPPRTRSARGRQAPSTLPSDHPGSRRSVRIGGNPTPDVRTRLRVVDPDHEDELAPPAWAAGERRRPRPRAVERLGGSPDRLAAWAFALGLLLVLAAATGHA
ncbi:MAG TPA: hypothetical protein VHX88_10950 [Solirubrobacteraceae bacterium]|jgi:hypothetical protein|nr:hypothetical protein [Solirubrobacteraceae bacterium]